MHDAAASRGEEEIKHDQRVGRSYAPPYLGNQSAVSI
jgi:hypothetical protein